MIELSYEEVREIMLDILAEREKTEYGHNQYENIRLGVAEVCRRRNPAQEFRSGSADLFISEVFWDLFRQGIITIGSDTANREFPFFRLSIHGKKMLDSDECYFYHDISSYETRIREAIPNINETTLLYLKEAMNAYRANCILSATVMLGVASEHSFDLLLQTVQENSDLRKTYSNVFKENIQLRRFIKFKSILEQNINKIDPPLKEDLDTDFAGILSIIRVNRNEAGHPTGKIKSREKVYVLLNLYIPYCKKIYDLMTYFREYRE